MTEPQTSPAIIADPLYDKGTGTDALLRDQLGRIADEVAARNTRVAIALPVPEIISLFHRVVPSMPRIPDYDATLAPSQVWSAAPDFSTDEIPEQAPELRVQLGNAEEIGDQVVVTVETIGAVVRCPLPLERAEQFFLAGLAAVRAGQTAAAMRPVEGISQDEVEARLAERGIVVTTD